jgi:hypothetical protein
MSRSTIGALTFALAVFACGCHDFKVVNGRPAMDEPAPGYDDKLHSAVIGDVVVVEKPTQLNAVCPQGWAKIERRETVVDGLVTTLAAVTAVGGVYKADSISVTCAQGPSTQVTPPSASRGSAQNL